MNTILAKRKEVEMSEVLELLKSPEFYGLMVALLAALRGIGEVFAWIGKLIPGDDWAESLSAKISIVCVKAGKVFAWLGIGSKK